MKKTSDNTPVWSGDYLIIGAGPAGLQLGYYLQQAGRDYCILESGTSPGSFFKEMPKHRTLISINKVFTGYEDSEINLRWDWNSLLSDDEQMLFKNYSSEYFPHADLLVRYLEDYAKRFKLNVKTDTLVKKVSKTGKMFQLTDEKGNIYSAKRVIVATGVPKAYVPEIKGIDLCENYVDMDVNPEEYRNQHVLILGKGNTAFEIADGMVHTAAVIHLLSPTSVQFAWKSHYVGHLRAVNNNMLDTYQLKSQNAIIDANILKISRRDDGKLVVSIRYSHAMGEEVDLVYDRVVVATGFRMDNSIFDKDCQPELKLKDRFPVLNSDWESTNIDDLYFIGTLMQTRDFKKTTSGFIHGFRYNIRSLFHILEQKYHRRKWLAQQEINSDANSLQQAILERINRTSALWQQFGFLGDLITVDDKKATYYNEVPTDYIHDSKFGKHDNYFVVTLEFGSVQGDPFMIERSTDPSWAKESPYLHPVIRHYRGSELVGEQHLLEQIYSEWTDEKYTQPLLDFLNHELSAGKVEA